MSQARKRIREEEQGEDSGNENIKPKYSRKKISPTSSIYNDNMKGLGARSKNLNDQRLEGELCDVVLVADEGVKFFAHRCVLAAWSEYFSRMFKQAGFSESLKQEIELKGVPGEPLVRILDFIYTGSLEITTDNVHAVVQVADYLLIPDVNDLCSHFMMAILETDEAYEEAVQIAETADRFNFHDLSQAAWRFIYNGLRNVARSKHFKELPLGEVTSILSRDIYFSDEEDVWWAAISWLEHDLEQRESHFDEIMGCVRFPLISLDVLLDTVKPHKLVRESEHLRDVIDDAVRYQAFPLQRSRMQTMLTTPRGSVLDGVFCLVGTETFMVYCPSQRKWLTLASPLPGEPPEGHSKISYNVFFAQGNLYVVGKTKSDVSSKEYSVQSLQVYDEDENAWYEKHLPSQCDNTVFVNCGEALYACSLNAVEVYDDIEDSWRVLCEHNFEAYDFVSAGAGLLRFYHLATGNPTMTMVDTEEGDAVIQRARVPAWMNNALGLGISQVGPDDFMVSVKTKNPTSFSYNVVKMEGTEIKKSAEWDSWSKLGYPIVLHQRRLLHVASSQKGTWIMATHSSVMGRNEKGRDYISGVSDGIIPFFEVKNDGNWVRLPSIPEQPGKNITLCACYDSGTTAACRYL